MRSPGARARPLWAHGDMLILPAKGLARLSAFGHIWCQVAHPGSRCSQGGVKIPTGGKGDVAQARERLLYLPRRRVSRFGAIPKPTVIVRMKENGLRRPSRFCTWADVVPYALILVLKEESHEADVAR